MFAVVGIEAWICGVEGLRWREARSSEVLGLERGIAMGISTGDWRGDSGAAVVERLQQQHLQSTDRPLCRRWLRPIRHQTAFVRAVHSVPAKVSGSDAD